MEMADIGRRFLRLGILGLATLAGCDAATQDGAMSWARAALERNDRLEIVAVDEEARIFTVRMKDTGSVRAVSVDELVAGPPGETASTVTRLPESATAPEATTAAPETAAAAEPQAPAAEPAEARPPEAPEAPPEPPEAPEAARPAVAAAAAGGRVIASGPGYSIVAAPAAAQGPGESREAAARRTGVERRSEPIVCQGRRFMHIDGRTIEFEGDAVRAQDGCELHVTNSRIIAAGVGIAARGAQVHIKNSQVEGASGSIEASEGAHVYAQSSTFGGMARWHDDAELHDLGGNAWN